MKVTYDPEVDVLRILFSNAPIEESDEDKPGVIIDYDKDGNIVGLEILDASKRMDNPRAVDYAVIGVNSAMSNVFRPNRPVSYDDDSILAEIRRVINEHFQGKPPSSNKFDKFSSVKIGAIRRHFGSWGNAVQKAGFEYKGKINEHTYPRREKYTEDQLIADLQRTKELHGGQYFTQAFYKANNGIYSFKTFKKYFKCSWQTLLKSQLSIVPAVVPKIRVQKYNFKDGKRISKFSDQNLFYELKRVWDTLDRRPSYTEFKKISSIGVKVYERRFGSWTLAIEWFYAKSGYGLTGSRPGFNTTPNILLSEIKKIAHDHTGIFTFDKYRNLGGLYSIGTFQKHFGSWRAAVEKIGRLHGHVGKYSNEELFDEIQRLWEMYGRQPTYKDMNRDGSISSKAFQNRFGSWMKAVHAFCRDRSSLMDENLKEGDSPKAIVEDYFEPKPLGKPVVQIKGPISTSPETIIIDTPRLPSLRLRFQVMKRDNFRCLKCGRSPANHLGLELEIDHNKPYSQGGPTVLDNLRTLCKECNRGKSNIMP